MQRLSLCAAAVAGALLLASCGADDDDAPAPAPTTVLASIDGQAAVDFDLLLLAARARTAAMHSYVKSGTYVNVGKFRNIYHLNFGKSQNLAVKFYDCLLV